MKKFLFGLIAILLLSACGDMNNTPTKKVEEFLGKYQKMDSEVLKQLDEVVDEDVDMSDKAKKEYKALLQKQYQNLSYKIKDEKTEADQATVDTEIEVYDYRSALDNAEKYYEENKEKEEFLTDGKSDLSKYMDYKIAELKKVADKRKYTITFTLHREDGNWKIDELSDVDIEKLHGLYV